VHVSGRIRLIIIVSCVLAVAFVSVSVFNYNTAKKSINEEVRSASLPLLRENIYSEIQKDFIPAVNISSMMAADSFLKNWALAGEKDPGEIIQFLREIHRTYGYFSTFFVSARTKNYYHYSGILKQLSPEDEHDVWYYRFVESGKDYELDVDNDEASMNKLTIFINFRVEDYEGNLLGITGVGIEMGDFSEFLLQQQNKYKRRIFFVDHSGVIQAHSDNSKIAAVSIQDEPGIQNIAEKLLTSEAEPLDAAYRRNHEQVLITSRYIPEMDWFLLVEQDERASLASARTNLWRTILIGFGTSVVIIIISAVTINFFQKRLERLAITDELTGAANRRELERQFQKAIYRYQRYKVPITLIILDIDHFKEINDTRGHNEGDAILTGLSAVIQENIRPDDLLARWGGDEFIVMLESTADETAALAKRLTEALDSRHIQATVSMGVAEYDEGDTLESLVGKADSALYQSKKEGRNRYTIYTAGGSKNGGF
jgi:diguanylate cyclase (GGDEF)-like protein